MWFYNNLDQVWVSENRFFLVVKFIYVNIINILYI